MAGSQPEARSVQSSVPVHQRPGSYIDRVSKSLAVAAPGRDFGMHWLGPGSGAQD